jgi:hypothetical protein
MMEFVRYLCVLAMAGLAFGQGTTPKDKVEDYEVAGRAGRIAIGAEYLVHSFSGSGNTFLAADYLVVEVALYPPKGEKVKVEPNDFGLRIDGHRALSTAAAQEVARALEQRNWYRERGLEGAVGVGDKTVILGGPPQSQPPYGDQSRRLPQPPKAPEPDYRGNVPAAEPVRAGELAMKTALPAGDFAGAVSGYLYFFYKGKPSKIKTVELVYKDAVLQLK